MREKIDGIVIDIIRHNDRYNVVTLFTRTKGRVAFLSPVGKGKRASLRAARIAPLAWLEADVDFHGQRELQVLSNISLHRVWHTLYFNPVKSSLTLFVSEFLNRLLRTSTPDEMVFREVTTFVTSLDDAKGSIANHHILFLVTMLRGMGIAPLADGKGEWFDMRAGVFTASCPTHSDYLSPQDTVVMKSLLRMNHRNAHRFKFSGRDRSVIIQRLLQYYEIHLPGSGRLKSLEILREIYE